MALPIRRIQDPVHGLMEFRGLEALVLEVLTTPELQRLRRIRQLGMAHQVFPGGEHSRLSHVLGSAHLAIRFMRHLQHSWPDRLTEALRPSAETTRDMAIAALCHDIGHGPMSHAWERIVIGSGFDRRAWAMALGLDPADEELAELKWHELVGQAFLAREDGALHNLLEHNEQGMSMRLRQMLVGTAFPPYLPRLLSSDVDVDRADFLLRDAHFCGVNYGRYDVDWLISSATVGIAADGSAVLGFDAKKAPRVVEEFLTARGAMYDMVYHHKTVRSVEGMIGRLLRRLLAKHSLTIVPVPEIFLPYEAMLGGAPVGCDDLLRVDDFSLSQLIDVVQREGTDPVAKDLARRIANRVLFKQVPVGSDRVLQLIKDEQMNAVREVVQKKAPIPDAPECYVFYDEVKVSGFEESANCMGYFVDSKGVARPMRNHEMLRGRADMPSVWRLFTISEACDAVRDFLT
jgi:HD superfamily phosphohydrolase